VQLNRKSSADAVRRQWIDGRAKLDSAFAPPAPRLAAQSMKTTERIFAARFTPPKDRRCID
jgi:hypothetical protein